MSLDDFFFGMATAFDLGGTLTHPEVRRILNQTDEEAIASDWKAVGDDLRTAMEKELDGS